MYTGLIKFLDDVPKQFGYDYFIENGSNANFTDVILRKISENFVLRWQFENDLLYSYQIDQKYAESLKTIFFNKIFFPKDAKVDKDYLYGFIELVFADKTPNYKILSLLEHIRRQMLFDGDSIDLNDAESSLPNEYWRASYMNNLKEFEFYMEAIYEMGYIKYELAQGAYFDIRFTLSGLNQVIQLISEKMTKICFVAMSFEDEMFKIYNEGIRPAIIETGFEPLIISEKKDIPSDTTINDAILAAIKNSKFTIADFTSHKHGVYFESGYALGRGQKVIYTCRQDQIEKAHFDTRNYPHIVWKDAEDLKKQLIDKIEVFIKS